MVRSKHLAALAAAIVTTFAAQAAFACNYDTQVEIGTLPVCFSVFGGCGDLTLESTCDEAITFEEVDCTSCGPVRTLQTNDIQTYPLELPEALEGESTTQAFRWASSAGTQGFVDVTTTYTTSADVACAASSVHGRASGGGAVAFLIAFGGLLLWRRRTR